MRTGLDLGKDYLVGLAFVMTKEGRLGGVMEQFPEVWEHQ